MIKANELRVGNKIKWGETTHTVENIYSPNMDFQFGSVQTDIMDAERGLEEYDPIILTPEILEKAGFEPSLRLDFNEWSLRYYIEVGVTLFFNDIPTSITIKYLHQLQNLYFALTGQESEWEPTTDLIIKA